ncbi:hypothetical protein KYJ26_06990 [Bacillus sp. MCCB 382]|nr:hypothetical protein [Bacillus sp. MCCB 382]
MIGAINTGIDSIGVTYGDGSFEELSHCNPTFTVDKVDQVKDILMGSEVK